MVISRKGKIAIAVVGVLFIAYLGKVTWQDQIQKADRQIYKIWVIFKEALDRRTQLIPQFAQLMQYYAPQAKEEIDLLNQSYEAVNTQLIKEILSDPAAHKAFVNQQQQVRNALLAMDKVAGSYPNLAQNRHYLLLRTQLQEVDRQILYTAKALDKKIGYYNNFLEGFPEGWINKLFFRYPIKIAITGQEEPNERR